MRKFAKTVVLASLLAASVSGCAGDSGSYGVIGQCLSCGGSLIVAPNPVVFGTELGSTETISVDVGNLGPDKIEIADVRLVEHTLDDPAGKELSEGEQWFETAQLGPGESRMLEVVYQPGDRFADDGTILIEVAGDSPVSGTYEVRIQTTVAGREVCFEFSHADGLNFGASGIGYANTLTLTIENCSSAAELEINEIAVTEDPADVFVVKQDTLPDELREGMPYALEPGASFDFVAAFTPRDYSESAGKLAIESNDMATPSLVVPLSGHGVDNQCPVAVAKGSVDGGEPSANLTATVGSVLRLDGSMSYDPDGSITRFEWDLVRQPEGSQGNRLIPSADAPNPSLGLLAVGEYVFTLSVFDNGGLASCEIAEVRVDVVE
jgi:hypothetical protein